MRIREDVDMLSTREIDREINAESLVVKCENEVVVLQSGRLSRLFGPNKLTDYFAGLDCRSRATHSNKFCTMTKGGEE